MKTAAPVLCLCLHKHILAARRAQHTITVITPNKSKKADLKQKKKKMLWLMIMCTGEMWIQTRAQYVIKCGISYHSSIFDLLQSEVSRTFQSFSVTRFLLIMTAIKAPMSPAGPALITLHPHCNYLSSACQTMSLKKGNLSNPQKGSVLSADSHCHYKSLPSPDSFKCKATNCRVCNCDFKARDEDRGLPLVTVAF